MPNYEFICPKCTYFETTILKVDERNNNRMCPKCGSILERQIGNVGFDLRGEGFYCNREKYNYDD
ncbi:MAG: hypothetical protein M0R03_13070 [Novosphingobium sp.]|nr:hypothetical protein [Novosphingobium sp.]